jgi:1-deoxy-D-xylulose-5-phosphate synthase
MLTHRNFPADLKSMGAEELAALCEEIRQEIVAVCLRNGGHLGASLGAVEIAVALHRIFDSPRDKLIWDVGHQAYAHKLLTGRAERFPSLRTKGGLSGFLSREESPHDIFGAGHSSTALSAALGVAYQNKDWTVAVIGDGGMTAGVSFEALNNVLSPNPRGPLLVILNDNQMSISENVGGIHRVLSDGRAPEFFQLFGFEYVGPLSGHDLPTLLGTLNGIRSARPARPILLHLITQKGKGYSPAEERPAYYHGVGPTQPKGGEQSWSEAFGLALVEAAEKNPRVLAITAAMGDGTGLLPFAARFPERYFDVGIAEPHAVTFAGGLATQGWRPVCAIYSTFLQRAFDAIIHDVALQKQAVVFAVDRAGLVGADGPTHHGVFDLAYAGMVPNTQIFTPEFSDDVAFALERGLQHAGPTFIRYPRGKTNRDPARPAAAVRVEGATLEDARKIIFSFGPVGVRVRTILSKLNPEMRARVMCVSIIQASPAPTLIHEILASAAHRGIEVLFFEDGIFHGGLSSSLVARTPGLRAHYFTYPDEFIGHGEVLELEEEFGRTTAAILDVLKEGLEHG